MNNAVILNVILDLAALAPILLLAQWGIKTGRRDIRRVEAHHRAPAHPRREAQADSA